MKMKKKNKILAQIVLFGEDEKKEYTLKEAAELLGTDLILAILDGGKNVVIRVDSDYYMKFKFKKAEV